MRPALLVAAGLLLSVPLTALADTDVRFVKLRDASEKLGGLGAFLEDFVGDCEGAMAAGDCKAKASKFRAEAKKKKFYMIVDEDSAGGLLSAGAYDSSDESFTLNITPFFSGGEYALTAVVPTKTDANGNPRVPLLTTAGNIPESFSGARFNRLFSNRALRIQVVFTPQDVWSLPKKGGGKIWGIKAKLDAVLVTIGRTGEVIGLHLSK